MNAALASWLGAVVVMYLFSRTRISGRSTVSGARRPANVFAVLAVGAVAKVVLRVVFGALFAAG